MLDKLRYWLSAELVALGIRILPDEYTKGWMQYGITVAREGILDGLTQER